MKRRPRVTIPNNHTAIVELQPPEPELLQIDLDDDELDLILEGLAHLAASSNLHLVADVDVLDAWLRYQHARQRRARLTDSAGITGHGATHP
jgi:hypothetical protein